MYSTSEGNGIVFSFITIHPNEWRMKRVRLPQWRMQTVIARSGPVRCQGVANPIPSDSLQFVRKNSLKLIVSFKTQKSKVPVEKLKTE